MGGLGERGGARKWQLDGAGRPAVVELCGGAGPVKEGRRGMVGELRGGVGNRFRGLSRAEEGWGVELRGELLAVALMAGGGGSGRRGRHGQALGAGRRVEGEVESLLAKQMEGWRAGQRMRRG